MLSNNQSPPMTQDTLTRGVPTNLTPVAPEPSPCTAVPALVNQFAVHDPNTGTSAEYQQHHIFLRQNLIENKFNFPDMTPVKPLHHIGRKGYTLDSPEIPEVIQEVIGVDLDVEVEIEEGPIVVSLEPEVKPLKRKRKNKKAFKDNAKKVGAVMTARKRKKTIEIE